MRLIHGDVTHVTNRLVIYGLVQIIQVPTIVEIPSFDDPVGMSREEPAPIRILTNKNLVILLTN